MECRISARVVREFLRPPRRDVVETDRTHFGGWGWAVPVMDEREVVHEPMTVGLEVQSYQDTGPHQESLSW